MPHSPLLSRDRQLDVPQLSLEGSRVRACEIAMPSRHSAFEAPKCPASHPELYGPPPTTPEAIRRAFVPLANRRPDIEVVSTNAAEFDVRGWDFVRGSCAAESIQRAHNSDMRFLARLKTQDAWD